MDMTYVEVPPERFESALPEIARQQDEPFGIAQHRGAVVRLRGARAAAGLKVMLDGQGADEVLGGYHGYFPLIALGAAARAAAARVRAASRAATGERSASRPLVPRALRARQPWRRRRGCGAPPPERPRCRGRRSLAPLASRGDGGRRAAADSTR